MKNMNRLTRICGLKCRHRLHELTGGMTLYLYYNLEPGYRLAG